MESLKFHRPSSPHASFGKMYKNMFPCSSSYGIRPPVATIPPLMGSISRMGSQDGTSVSLNALSETRHCIKSSYAKKRIDDDHLKHRPAQCSSLPLCTRSLRSLPDRDCALCQPDQAEECRVLDRRCRWARSPQSCHWQR